MLIQELGVWSLLIDTLLFRVRAGVGVCPKSTASRAMTHWLADRQRLNARAKAQKVHGEEVKHGDLQQAQLHQLEEQECQIIGKDDLEALHELTCQVKCVCHGGTVQKLVHCYESKGVPPGQTLFSLGDMATDGVVCFENCKQLILT